ncbi:chemotaxis response regulator protein-glutamate methylesterase [Saccharibacillus sp. O16]|nr:chemotaxis response regulator protein-glutamate methylesterase [Saccharibacillus sp. O16]
MVPYRVLVVDDSAFMRKIVSDLIERDVSFSVVDTAKNGREAVEKIRKIKPDIVTMDVEMPEMNGLESLQQIMREYPLPVIMLSGINEEGMRETIMALEAGAFDFIRKPSVSNSQDIETVGEALLRQLHAAVHDSAWRKEKPATTKAPVVLAPEPVQRELRESTLEGPPVETGRPEERTPDLPRPKIEPSAPEARPRKDAPTGFTATPRTTTPTPASKPSPAVPPSSGTKPTRTPAVPPERPAQTRPAADKPAARAESAPAPTRKSAAPTPAPTPSKSPVQERKTSERPAVDRPTSPPASPPSRSSVGGDHIDQIVTVGCSTGGPRALKELLENIPASFPAPIVIVQHMPPKFTHSLAQRLNTLSPLEVVEAQQGMALRKGTAYIAPGGQHLLVRRTGSGQYAIELSDAPPQNGHKPSVGAMFDSVLPLNEVRRHAVIMTGMGSDGAKEMKKLYDSGISTTIAESEETCVVYGMPRAAAELNCVMHLLPLPQIATKLNQVVKS